MTEEITAETEISKAAMIARKYIDSPTDNTIDLVEVIPHLMEAFRLIFINNGIENHFFWKSPVGKQLSTIKEAMEVYNSDKFDE